MGKFYITTPIYYVNDKPHLGHGFTTVAADVMARWHRLKGDEVFFLTGTDEHGEKNQKAAEARGLSPQEYVDDLSGIWKETWKKLEISYDGFVRTSGKSHGEAAIAFIGLMEKSGDIYKGNYEGWYCVSDETFLTDLQLVGGKCPHCGRDVKRVKEESYFFRLSKYQEMLLEHYAAHPDFLSPLFRSDEIKNRVKAGLRDLSITRSTLSWGVPFPSDSKHTVYVWVEALVSYLSGIGWPGKQAERFWPADVHLVGKEINWFHAVIWPAMLFSAGMAPPRRIFAHGWWTIDGKKMSKSVGNVVDPVAIAEKYSVDAFRYFVIREKPLGEDGDFSEKALVARINGELVADLGNLVSRVVTLAERFDGKISGKPELESMLNLGKIDSLIEKQDLSNALEEIWSFVRSANKYVNEKAPWKLDGEELSNALYNLAESCRIISILIYPFMPSTARKINEQLGTVPGTLDECRFGEFKGRIRKGEHLFRKVESA
jgi:methionyl-tRNA synthetase